MLGGERESQGEAKFRAPPLKYSKYSYVYLVAHVYRLLLHLFPRITSLCQTGLVILKLLLDLFRLYPTLHSTYQFLDTKRDVYSKTEISGNNYCLDKNLRLRRHYSTYRVKS